MTERLSCAKKSLIEFFLLLYVDRLLSSNDKLKFGYYTQSHLGDLFSEN